MSYQSVFSRVAGHVLGAEGCAQPQDGRTAGPDLPFLLALFRYHELLCAVHPCFKEVPGWGGFAQAAAGHYYATVARAQVLEREFADIQEAFLRAGVLMVPLKGMAFLLEVYHRRPLRTMTDIDLLVRPASLDRAVRVMRELGYAQRNEGLSDEYWRSKQCHLQFSGERPQRTVPVDLHYGLDYRRRGRIALEDCAWERLRNVDGSRGPLPLLSAEDTVLSLVLHQRRSLKPLCLKYAVDLAGLLRAQEEGFDSEYLFSRAGREKMLSGLYMLLSLAEQVFPGGRLQRLMRRAPLRRGRKRHIGKFVSSRVFSWPALCRQKQLFLANHFLQFDDWKEPVVYIVGIPREQFAKFYALPPAGMFTGLLYRMRCFYMPLRWCCEAVNGWVARLAKAAGRRDDH